MKTRYQIISTTHELNKLIQACKETKRACVDFETNGEKIYNATFIPTILSVSFQPGSSIIIPLGHQDSPLRESWLPFLRKFGREVIENPDITKFGWNWKFDNQIFSLYQIFSRGVVIDGMLAKYVLNEERPNGLKDMVDRYLPDYAGYEDKDGFDKIPWSEKPFDPLCEYSATDTDMTLRLCTFFEKKLIDLNMYTLYRNLIMPSSIVLQSVEKRGLAFDRNLNLELHTKYEELIKQGYAKLIQIPKVRKFQIRRRKALVQAYIDDLEVEIADLKRGEQKPSTKRSIQGREDKIVRIMAGKFTTKKEKAIDEDINFGSTKQLIELLYTSDHGFKYPIIAYTKDKKNNRDTTTPSTAEETLLALLEHDKYGFINDLLELRGYEHTYAAFIKGYVDLIQSDGRIHPKFNIHTTVTGRLSSSDPNAQQIPKKEVNPDIKKQFITPPGQLFFALDYSQAELRIMAHLSGDETLLEAFRLGRDPHLSIACKKYGEDYDKILPIYLDETNPEYKKWKVRRKQAKQIVFGCIYGIEAKKLAKQLSDVKSGLIVTKEEAQKFLNEFFEDSPKVKKFMSGQQKRMERDGFVKTLFGRKRRCPNIYSENYGKYLEAVRASFNAPCQSAASDMALFASILIYWEVKRGNLPYLPEVSTVHDAIYNYASPAFINPWVVYQYYQICKNPDTKRYFGFSIKDVDMAMDFSIGRTMIEELPYTPGYDYNKMLLPDFSIDEYFKEHNKTKSIPISDYPKEFPEYFTKEFMAGFRKTWTNLFNNTDLG